MRLNVYSQELITENDDTLVLEPVQQLADTGVTYSAVRMFLHSSDRLHHTKGDDDRSAITFWLPKSPERRALVAAMFEEMAALVMKAPLETGLDT